MKTLRLLFTVTAVVIMVLSLFTGSGERFYHPEFGEKGEASFFGVKEAFAYPPAVGILSGSRNCMSCHADNGPWKDDAETIIDILDADTKKSLRQPDGSFLIEVKKGKRRTVLTVIGSKKKDPSAVPYRNAWLYVDPSTIGTGSMSKFAPGWEVNLQMSCRIAGDRLPGYEDATITSLPMTVLPGADAKDAVIELQAMITKGASAKGNALQGLTANYFERKVKLSVK